ncbi:hypothetical protein FOCG_10122 [Fusarium oxysporum f. sp. radicis-lycopersici 26381]|uniref:Uncharacterized protein n=5 Tax=Fusarium oxysporum TaxID=5507 RepID=W9IF70_FUSOX|nr:hypothetical protein FOYG_06725 [Fusarium oxysporum NRRL 32931]EWZ51122.1 hypothetical protein FOZG_01327 [Fusarium oxysporum Fo47]EXK48377.1 hypothetical protein FOMG_01333 [Fusarium oxysporum f. sp. melonis 26406]EXL50001.1 hypothetical protein FOCG_10122 [Fusarium oxysporum f. sp. radicis-lycopersici 26381]EXL87041.1 hypothetical protein FOPG_01914 [Fusarium oxysporum f. sp. conglutinans race 2 54008]EXM27718.1 hypothetical protein FOTG_06079 [Fusarium oxysporum f. sp. vasinfectum 25433]
MSVSGFLNSSEEYSVCSMDLNLSYRDSVSS